jgi:hypothetical protein
MPLQLMNMMAPVLGLVMWTFVMWAWLYAVRIPAMRAAGIDPAKVKGRESLSLLPPQVNWVADNYNHLHEQPTVFYALCTYSFLVGVKDDLNIWLAWAYVAIRIVHSLVQATRNFVPLRFAIFMLGTLVLLAIAVRDVIALFA